MRKTILILLVAIAVIWMFQHPDDLRHYSGEASRVAGEWFTKVADEWSPKPPPPEAPLLAPLDPPPPEGVYCLRQPIRFTSSNGTTLLGAGFEARKVGEGAGKLVLTDGVGQAVVDASLVTRDPQEIRALRHQQTVATLEAAAASRSRQADEIRQLDAKISSLRQELQVAMEKEMIAASAGRGIGMTTSTDFLRAEIVRLEKLKTEQGRQMGTASGTAPSPRTETPGAQPVGKGPAASPNSMPPPPTR